MLSKLFYFIWAIIAPLPGRLWLPSGWRLSLTQSVNSEKKLYSHSLNQWSITNMLSKLFYFSGAMIAPLLGRLWSSSGWRLSLTQSVNSEKKLYSHSLNQWRIMTMLSKYFKCLLGIIIPFLPISKPAFCEQNTGKSLMRETNRLSVYIIVFVTALFLTILSPLPAQAATPSFGSPATFISGNSYFQDAAKLTGNQFVVVYGEGSSDHITKARVASVTGTSISYGTAKELVTTTKDYEVEVAGLSSNTFVVAWRDGSSGGKVAAGTVSDTEITFGDVQTFDSNTILNIEIEALNSNKFVVAYRDSATPNKGQAVVGSVSDTTITLGSEANFNNISDLGGISGTSIAVLSPTTVVVSHHISKSGSANDLYGYSVVGTVSGNSITFGALQIFDPSGGGAMTASVALSSSSFLLAYDIRDGDNFPGFVRVATVSGTNITFGSTTQFHNNVAGGEDAISLDLISSDFFAIAYKDNVDSDGIVRLGTVSGTTITFDVATDLETSSNPQVLDPNVIAISSSSIVVSYEENSVSHGKAVVGTIVDNTSAEVDVQDNSTPTPVAPTPSTTPTGPIIITVPADKPIVQFDGDGNGFITASDRSSSKFSCHSSETCSTKIELGWYRFEPTADQDSEFVKWSGQNCNNGEYTTTFGGTCIAEFKLLPPQDPVDVTPPEPKVPDVTQPTPTDPTPPDVTQPTPTEPTTPVITEPVQPVEVNYVGFSNQAYKATENAGSVDITVNRIGTTGEISIDLLSADDSGKADIHYRPIEQTLFWANGDDTEILVPVAIIDNSEVDGDKNITLSLGNADNAELRVGTAILTIVDDDEKPQVVVKSEPTEPTPTVPVIIEEPVVIIPITEEPIVIMPDESATPTTVNSGPSISGVACNTSAKLATRCDAHVETISYQEVGKHGNLTGGTLDHPLTNEGLVSNTKITPNGSLKGGKISGYTNNEGLIEDVEFVGASITGKNADGEVVGIIGGNFVLASQIGGVVKDVNLAPDTQIVGRGTPKVGSEKNIDRIGGTIIGDSDKPATLERLHIKTKSVVSNVIIAENVTYGEGITFTNVEFRTQVVRKVILQGNINGTRFKETYTRIESVTIRANSHLSNLDIGDNVKFEASVTLDNSVTFSVHQRYMETHNIAVLPSFAGLAAIDNQGNSVSTWARLQGGARFGAAGSRGERYRKQRTLKRSKHKNVDVFGNVLTDVRHIGQVADILVVAAHTQPGASSPTFYMLDSNGTPLLWDMDMSSLVPFRAEVTLAPVVPVTIWNKPLDILGDVEVYFGYRLIESGDIVHSLEDVVEMEFIE